MEDADGSDASPDEDSPPAGTNGTGRRSGSSESNESSDESSGQTGPSGQNGPSTRWESEWTTRTSTEGESSKTSDDPDTHPSGPTASGAGSETETAAESRSQLSEADIREYTTDRRTLAPGVQLQWGFWTSISVVILTAILTGIVSFIRLDPRLGAVILVVLFVLGMAWVSKRYDRWVYQVQEDALYLERGVVTHVRTLVPYVRIQHVDTSQGPLERALGLSTLVVYTAGSRGADVSIPGLTPEEASDLQERVKELAIEAEGGDAL